MLKIWPQKLPEGEAEYYFSDFPVPLLNVDKQTRFAEAFDASYRRLSKDHKEDLKNSKTTLNAAGYLASPGEPLWVVNPTVSSAGLVPKTQQLHPQLHKFKSVANLCQKFDIAQWSRTVAQKAIQRDADEVELEALYRHILASHGQFDRRTKAMLRKAPIIKDHEGRWVAPASITDSTAAGARLLERVLHLPHAGYKSDVQLKKSLRFRTKVSGDDLVDYANHVARHPEIAGEFEVTLWKLKRLLSPTVIKKLSQIPIVPNSNGGFSPPAKTYLPTKLNKSSLGQEAPFVISKRVSLYEKLGCPSTPRSEDILAHIEALRERNCQPSDADVLYTALVETLKKEGTVSYSHADERILWVQDGFFAPSDVLIGANHRKTFLDAVPQIDGRGMSLRRSAEALGGNVQPKSHHWAKLFRWFGERSQSGKKPVTQAERAALGEAYNRLPSIPEGVSDEWRFLLDRQGMTHSLLEATNGEFVIDDDPRLAEAASEQDAPISFADTTAAGSLRFFSRQE